MSMHTQTDTTRRFGGVFKRGISALVALMVVATAMMSGGVGAVAAQEDASSVTIHEASNVTSSPVEFEVAEGESITEVTVDGDWSGYTIEDSSGNVVADVTADDSTGGYSQTDTINHSRLESSETYTMSLNILPDGTVNTITVNGDYVEPTSDSTDSTTDDSTSDAADGILGGLFGSFSLDGFFGSFSDAGNSVADYLGLNSASADETTSPETTVAAGETHEVAADYTASSDSTALSMYVHEDNNASNLTVTLDDGTNVTEHSAEITEEDKGSAVAFDVPTTADSTYTVSVTPAADGGDLAVDDISVEDNGTFNIDDYADQFGASSDDGFLGGLFGSFSDFSFGDLFGGDDTTDSTDSTTDDSTTDSTTDDSTTA